MSFQCVVADPPWKFNDRLPGNGIRGAAKHYSVLTVDDICRLDLPPIHDDAYLFLWRVAAMPEEALRVIRAWGFTPKAELVWLKRTSTGKRWFGMGRHVRMEHEVSIIATRGKPKRKVANVRSTFEAVAGPHSQKPEEFFDIVEALCDGPRVEIFARQHRPGWICLGDELGTPLKVKS